MSKQMSYVHRPHCSALEHLTLFQLLDLHAAKQPNKDAFIYRDQKSGRKTLTFEQYQSQSQALAVKLLELGLGRGDNVLVMLPSGFPFVISHLAVNRVGSVFIPIEIDDSEYMKMVRDQIACVIYTHESEEMADALDKVLAEPHFKAAICVNSSLVETPKRVYKFEELLCEGSKSNDFTLLRKAEAEVRMDDPCLIIHTSGSTGRPKPVVFTNHGFVNGALSAAYTFNAKHDSILFSDSPFDWISGIGFSLSLVPVLGMTFVIFPPNLALKGGMTETILKIVDEEKCTHSIFLAYFLQDLVMYKGISLLDLSCFKFCLTGGQLTEINLLKKVFDVVPHLSIILGYGATEMFTVCRQLLTKENVERVNYGTMEINPGFEVKVVDSDERVVAVETAGEVYVRSAAMLQSADGLKLQGIDYSHCKTVTGWFRSKDRAIITSEGTLKVLGRTDNLIKCATESIQPGEVEAVLRQHPKILSAIAIGIPDQRLFEVVCACVILKPGYHGDESDVIEEIDKWCSDKFVVSTLGLSSQPRHYVIFEKFPTTRTGKTSRKNLKEMAIERLGLNIVSRGSPSTNYGLNQSQVNGICIEA